MNRRRSRQLTALILTAAGACGFLAADELLAEVRLFGKKSANSMQPTAPNVVDSTAEDNLPSNTNSATATAGLGEKKIRLNYFSKTWDDVLKDLAKQSNRAPLIDKVPPGRFSRNDWNRYSLTEALRILNRELEPKGFRILDRGQFLDLVFLRDARQDYQRPVLDVAHATQQLDDADDAITDIESPQAPKSRSSDATRKSSKQTARQNGIQQASYNSFMDESYKREEIDALWRFFYQPLAKLDTSYASDVWNPNPTPLCGWCPVKTCDYYKEKR